MVGCKGAADGAQPIILYSVAADVEGGQGRVGLEQGGQVPRPITGEAVTADVQVEKGMVLPEVSAQPLHPSVSDDVFAEAQLLQCDIHLTESDYEEGLVPLLLPHKN